MFFCLVVPLVSRDTMDPNDIRNRQYFWWYHNQQRPTDRETFICLLVKKAYDNLAFAMRLHDPVIAEMLLSSSDTQLRDFAVTPMSHALFPNDLRFARALYALNELAIHLDVDHIINRWNFQDGQVATFGEYEIIANQIPDYRDRYG